ncbi:MAG TPA: TonB-dependent receptor, partial [Steroidobacteraceae bacterium]|nr:TonB-dependent receptor [Steroidobacteraceae bacterium]
FTNLDWSGYPGGINTTPGAANNPYTPFPSSITGYLLNPFTASSAPFAYLPGCNATAEAANQCTYTLAEMQIQPPTEQINVLGKLTKTLTAGWEASVQASFFSSRAQQVENNYPPFDFDVPAFFAMAYSPANPVPQIVPNPPALLTVPANYPGNPFGVAAPLIYNFHELGQPIIDTTADTYRLLAEVTGPVAGWSVDAAVGIMYAHMLETYYGNLEYTQLQNALDNGYQVGLMPSSGGAALFAPPMEETPTNSLRYIDLHASRPLLQLPAGPASLAVGVQYFDNNQNQKAAGTSAEGIQTELAGPHFVVGSQEDLAVFAELDGHILKTLEFNAAGRYDHYDTYGSSATPKFGLKYQPTAELALRGTWGKGFRAPTVAESGKSATFFPYGYFSDPVLCPNPNGPNGLLSPGNYPLQCNSFLLSYEPSNPKLKAVESTQFTLGAIFEPFKAFNVSLDYYNIKLANDIITAIEPVSFVRGAPTSMPYVNAAGGIVIQTPSVGPLLYADYPYVNAQATHVSGIDVDMRGYLDLGRFGRLTAGLSYTHEFSYTESIAGTTYQLAGTHGPGISGNSGNPKERAVLSLGWDRGPLDVTTTINYTGPFSITDPTSGFDTCLETLNDSFSSAYGVRFSASTVPNQGLCTVRGFTDVNLYARYALSKRLNLHASILNLFNQEPPLDLETIGGGGELAYDAPQNQIGAVGRFFTLGATYTF